MRESTIQKCQEVAKHLNDGMGLPRACRRAGVSKTTFLRWRELPVESGQLAPTINDYTAELAELVINSTFRAPKKIEILKALWK